MIQIRNTIYKHGVYCVQKPNLLLFTLNSDMHIDIQKILGILRTKSILIYLHYLESDNSVKNDILFLKNQKLILNLCEFHWFKVSLVFTKANTIFNPFSTMLTL